MEPSSVLHAGQENARAQGIEKEIFFMSEEDPLKKLEAFREEITKRVADAPGDWDSEDIAWFVSRAAKEAGLTAWVQICSSADQTSVYLKAIVGYKEQFISIGADK